MASRVVPVTGLSALFFFTSGCQLIVNPFKDELAVHQPEPTASVHGVREAGVAVHLPEPRGTRKEVYAKDGTVLHATLFFEDPSEESGSEDGQFAWTGEDYLQIATWRALFLKNVLVWPVRAVVMPLWRVMASDGQPSRKFLGFDFDAVNVSNADRPSGSSGASATESPSRESS